MRSAYWMSMIMLLCAVMICVLHITREKLDHRQQRLSSKYHNTYLTRLSQHGPESNLARRSFTTDVRHVQFPNIHFTASVLPSKVQAVKTSSDGRGMVVPCAMEHSSSAWLSSCAPGVRVKNLVMLDRLRIEVLKNTMRSHVMITTQQSSN